MPLSRAALDARCRRLARDLEQRVFLIRRRVVFERLLERLSVAEPEAWMLKGGMALAYRWGGRGRETRDLDLTFLRPGQTGKDATVSAWRAPAGSPWRTALGSRWRRSGNRGPSAS